MIGSNGSAPSPTRSGQLHERLRGDILTGRLGPGVKLPFAQLVAEYGCSIGSLREVLQRLVESGLVESAAQQGFRVVPVSAEDLLDLTVARLEIEVAAFRHAVADGDLAWEALILSSHHVLEGTPRVGEPGGDRFASPWSIAHTAFHQALLSGCGNRRLRTAAESLRDVAELYRTWSIQHRSRSGRDTAGEHRAILDAALRRDVDQAAALLHSHIELTAHHLVPMLRAACGDPAQAEQARGQ